MGTIRVKHNSKYTVISNAAIRDVDLSFKARGVLHLLLSYPDDWRVNLKHLVQQSKKDGREAISSALKELKELGYMKQQRIRGASGRFEWEFIVYESREEANLDKESLNCSINGFPINGFSCDGQAVSGKPDYLISNDQTITDLESTDPFPEADPDEKQPHPIAPIQAIESGGEERSPEPESEPKGTSIPEPTGTEQPEVQKVQPPTEASKNQAHCQAGLRSDETRLPPADFFPAREILPSPELPPWRVRRGPNGWNQEIVQGVLDWMNHTFGGGKTRADAISYIVKREQPSHPEYEALLARVQEIKNSRLPAHPEATETLEESLERRGIRIATEPPPQPEFKGIPEEAMATWKMAREKLEQVKRDKERMERERRLGWTTT